MMADEKANATVIGMGQGGTPLEPSSVHAYFSELPTPKVYVTPQIDNPKWDILGTDCQIVQMALDPHEQVESESGAMMYMSNDCKQKMMWPKLGAALGGELLKVKTTNDGDENGYAGFTSSEPGMLIPVPTANYPEGISFQLGAWVASLGDVTTSVRVANKTSCLACCCGGIPLVVQSIRPGGNPGTAFVGANGTIVEKKLAAGEEIIIDQTSLVGFTNDVTIDVRRIGGLLYCLCSGEGLFNAVMTGPGTVWIQSMPLAKLKKLVRQEAAKKNKEKGEGAPESEEDMER